MQIGVWTAELELGRLLVGLIDTVCEGTLSPHGLCRPVGDDVCLFEHFQSVQWLVALCFVCGPVVCVCVCVCMYVCVCVVCLVCMCVCVCLCMCMCVCVCVCVVRASGLWPCGLVYARLFCLWALCPWVCSLCCFFECWCVLPNQDELPRRTAPPPRLLCTRPCGTRP